NKSTTRNVWIALDNGLLLTEIPSPFSQYDANDGLSLPISQLVRSEGTLYAISRTGVFQHRFTSRLSLSPSFLPVRGLEGVHYNSHGDSPTGLLIGTDEGLFQIRNRRAYVVSNDSTTGVHVLNNDQEVLLAATSQGVLWYTQNGNDWRLQGRIEGLPIDIKDIVEYGNGTLLMSSLKNGLYRVQYVNNGEEVTEIAFTSQEVNISGSLDPNNLSLTYLDKTNQILAISPNLFGIHSFNPSSRELLPLLSQEQIAASNPIWASNQISGLSEDLSGNVWAYSTSNIAQLIPKPGGGFEINTTDRLSNMGANGLFHDLNRDIWIANVDGVLRKADATPPLADQPSLTVIRNVTLTDGKSVFQDNSFYPLSLADSTIRISPDESSIEFTFSATKPSFITEWQYQYYLDGLDDTWSTPTDNNTAIYANLEPGNYIFKVRAFDDRGVMSEEETVALLVDKFWYQQTWAIALFVLAGLLLLAGIFFLVRFLLNKRQSNLANTFRKQQKVRSRPAGFSFRDNKTTPVTPEQTPEIPVEKVVEVNEPKVETEELSAQNTSWVSPTPIEKEEPKPVVAEAKEIIAEKEEVQVAPEPQPQAQPVEVAPVVPKETETSFSANKNHEQEIQSFMAKFDQLGKLLLTKPDTSTLHSRIENILKEFISFDIYGYGMPSSDHPGMDFRYKVHSNNEIISLNGNGQVPDSIAEWCLIRKEALLIGDVASEYGKFAQPGPPKGMLTLNGNSTPPPRSLMYVPLQIQNQTRGFITLQSFLPNLFREYHLQILQNLGNYLSLYMGSMEGNSSVEAMQEKVYQQDKMASLGELTKGLTREIGSPTSYIAKNIKALKQNLTEASDVWYQYECLSPEDAVAQLKDIDRMKATKDYDKKVADIFDYAQNVLKGAHRIAEILKGIRTYIGQEDDLKTINIHPNLDSALLILRHLYKGRIKITRDYGNIPEIPVFPAKLNQAFINILVNAIKSIDGQGSIYVQTMATGNHIQINIRDTGKGISEEDKQYLFEPFIHMDHGLNGSRVGLALTKDIILLHQGTIEVDSQPGAGTMFRIQLPTRLNLSTIYGNS
ncbi:MAG: ATP-binding protein, partial [Bacteroidota bacterium]